MSHGHPGDMLHKAETGIKDTGDRRTFTSGAQRDRAHGKGTFKLFPAIAYFFISRIYEDGALKYESRNWEKGMPIDEFVDSAERHIQKYKAGLRDEPHLSMAGWNIVCALWTAAMVHLGLRDKSLFNLPNHTPYDTPGPLSPYEEKALQSFMGMDERLNQGRVYKDPEKYDPGATKEKGPAPHSDTPADNLPF